MNPYLAIAGSLACGYLGLKKGLAASAPIEESAYDSPFALLRHPYLAIEQFRASSEVRAMFGDEFVEWFTAMKLQECVECEERVPTWERDSLGWTL